MSLVQRCMTTDNSGIIQRTLIQTGIIMMYSALPTSVLKSRHPRDEVTIDHSYLVRLRDSVGRWAAANHQRVQVRRVSRSFGHNYSISELEWTSGI